MWTFGKVALSTAGFTGADLRIWNEAAILAAKEGRVAIRQSDIESSFIKVGIGTERRAESFPIRRKNYSLSRGRPRHIISSVAGCGAGSHGFHYPYRVGAAGYTMPQPEKDEMFNTKGRMLQEIMVGLGGRIAEELVFEDITTGASQDIKGVTDTARAMVTQYGMSEKIGLVNYGSDDDEVFIGRDLAHIPDPTERNVASAIDNEVKRIIDDCYSKAKAMIVEHIDVLHRCADELIAKEKINSMEFEALFKTGQHSWLVLVSRTGTDCENA